ncbi:MAG: hypothetical protein R3258_05475 [Acidimicrobiia bacterium]|nr:hypothetical protein [Acidimicrobiia bacterium]
MTTEPRLTPRTVWAYTKRYAILAYGAIGTMFDVGLMVLGAMLNGLAISILLAGLGIVDSELDLSTGAMLVSAIVLSVVGLFCLGLASEGPLGRGRRLVGFKDWEVGVGRAIAVLIVGLGALGIYELLRGALEGLPSPLLKGLESIRAVGQSGITVVTLVGVPLSILVRRAPARYAWARLADVPVMFVVWAIATFAYLT